MSRVAPDDAVVLGVPHHQPQRVEVVPHCARRAVDAVDPQGNRRRGDVADAAIAEVLHQQGALAGEDLLVLPLSAGLAALGDVGGEPLSGDVPEQRIASSRVYPLALASGLEELVVAPPFGSGLGQEPALRAALEGVVRVFVDDLPAALRRRKVLRLVADAHPCAWTCLTSCHQGFSLSSIIWSIHAAASGWVSSVLL